MAKKKQKVKKTKKKKKEKPKKQKQTEIEKVALELCGIQTDVKTFLKKFKEDVSKKRKDYQAFARKVQKKKERFYT